MAGWQQVSKEIFARLAVLNPMGASTMQKDPMIDFSRLLGFDTVIGDVKQDVDLQDETLSDKLGAKIGPIEPSIEVDFREETLSARLGAKVGGVEAI